MDASEIITAIVRGDGDDNLDGIEAAIRDRKKVKGKAAFFTLKPGDKVRVCEHVRPKYLVGCEATVVRRNQTRLVIRFIDPPNGEHGKFSGEVTVQPDMIEAVSA
jgi:hypothetical protein